MRSLRERYEFLVKRLTVSDVDYWEGDAMLDMKPFCFGFSPERDAEKLNDIDAVIDMAIDSAEWDAKHNINCSK
jgi:tRNA (Thr-GGU) A37 N-methylase